MTATGIFWSRGRSEVAPAAWSAGVHGEWQWLRPARGHTCEPRWLLAVVARPAPDRRRVEPPGGPANEHAKPSTPWKAERPETAWMDANHSTTTPHGQKQTEPGEYCTYGVLVGSTAPLVVCVTLPGVFRLGSLEYTLTVLRNCGVATALPPAEARIRLTRDS